LVTTDGNDRSIVAERLQRTFASVRAVDGVDLNIPGGQIFGFLGPNGAGKSTVVRILTTILSPTSGRAIVAGYDIQRHGDKVRQAIGVALQDVGLDPVMTARELLVLQAQLFGLTRTEAHAKAERLLATVGLDGVDPRQRVGTYSGGMKRRLDLALALVHDPRILFLDEPTSGLDPLSRAAIWDEVRRLNAERGMTIFLTTQYLEEADRLADQIAIIDRGRIVAQGTPTELKRAVGSEVIAVRFASSDEAARAAQSVAQLAPRQQVAQQELRLYVDRAADQVPTLVRILDGAGIRLRGLTLEQPTLDDVFLRVTGQALPGGGGGGGGAVGGGGGGADSADGGGAIGDAAARGGAAVNAAVANVSIEAAASGEAETEVTK